MKLEHQLVNLKPSKKLKKLGVKQDSLFYWCIWEGREPKLMYEAGEVGKGHYLKTEGVRIEPIVYSAFTVAELLERLPYAICKKKRVRVYEYWLNIERTSHGWFITYEYKNETIANSIDASFKEALAKMLIYLKENGLIK